MTDYEVSGNAFWRNLTQLLSLIVLGYLAKTLIFDHAFDKHWVEHVLVEQGALSYLYLFGVGALATMVGLSRQLVAFLVAYAFGFWGGLLLSTAAATAGCMLAYYYSHYIGRHYLRARFGRAIGKVQGFLKQDTLVKTIVIRLLPIGSNLVTNIAAGLCGVRQPSFFAGSFVGYLPQMAVFSLAGSGISLDSRVELILSGVLMVVSSLLGVYLYRRYRRSRYLQQ